MRNTPREQQAAATRLSTGGRINSAADDPAGLVAVSPLSSQLGAVQAASENASRAGMMLEVADSAMGQISSLLTQIQARVVSLANDSGLSDDEKKALQMEIDSSIAFIDQLANTATFNGKKLLNGTLGIATSGVDSTRITDLDITGKTTAANVAMQVTVVSAARKAQVTWTGAGLAADNPVTLKITGEAGAVNLDFAGSSTIAQVATLINTHTAITGVHASASGGKLYFQSDHTGADEFVQVQTLSGTFSLDGGVDQDHGKNAMVAVNYWIASVNDLAVSFNTGMVKGTMNLDETFVSAAGNTTSFTVTDGGATFALSPDANDLYILGIGNMSSNGLKNKTLGYLSSLATGGANCAKDHAAQAVQIANEAAGQVARARGNIGGGQKHTVSTMQNTLASRSMSLTNAITNIRDVDYAMEMANMTRLNVLAQTQGAVLGMVGQHVQTILAMLPGRF